MSVVLDYIGSALPWIGIGLCVAFSCVKIKASKDEKELLENEQLKSYIADSTKTEKAIDFIVKNAKIK